MPLKFEKSGKNQEDAILLKQWYGGDEAAFNQLYDKYYGQAILYCLALCKERNISQEVTQNTFIKILDKVRNKKGKPIEEFRSYLFKSVSTNWLEYKRNTQRQQSRFAEVEESNMEAVAEDTGIERFMAKEIKEKILAFLNENDREIYKKHIAGYNYIEIADDLGLTEGQVRGKIFRMKDSIRKNKDNILNMINGVQ